MTTATMDELRSLARRDEILSKEESFSMTAEDLYWYSHFRKKWIEKLNREEAPSEEDLLPVLKILDDGSLEVKIKGTDKYYHVTAHAVKRFKERTDALQHHDPLKYLARELRDAMPAKTANAKGKVLALLNHNLENAHYMLGRRTKVIWVLVGDVVKTCHMNESKRYVAIVEKS